MKRCKHDLIQVTCSLCNPPQVATPRHREETTVFGAGAVQSTSQNVSFIVVHAKRNHASHNNLDPETKKVHIFGHPYLWLLEEIIKLAPNVKEIRLIPRSQRKLTESHYRLCSQHGIKIIFGHQRPEIKWEENSARRSQEYIAYQKFFRSLSGEQQTLFQELLHYGIEVAEMARDYYLIDHNPPLFLHDLGDKYGYKHNPGYISNQLHCLMHYLDPSFKVSQSALALAETLKNKVEKVRQQFSSAESEAEILADLTTRLSLPRLPDNLPFSRFDDFELIIQSRRNGRLQRLEQKNKRGYLALVLRFGIETMTPSTYRTLQEIADKLGVTSRERARQLEEKALLFLNS